MSEHDHAVSRRRLMTVLGAGGAAVAATQLSGQLSGPANAASTLTAPALRVEDYGAVGDGTTDDSAALNAALQAARPDLSPRGPAAVQLLGKTYAHASEIVVPDGVQLFGVGHLSTTGVAGSILKATGSAAAVHVRGSGSGLSELMVDANATAAVGIHTGGLATGDDGSDQWYLNVVVGRATVQNWLIERTQNSSFVNCRSNGGYGEGVFIDYGAGGHVFSRCEFNSAWTGANLHIGLHRAGTTGYPSPTNIMFLNCQAEARTSDGPEVRIEGGQSLRFEGLSVYHPTSGHVSPLILVTGGARATFSNLMAGGAPDMARVAIQIGPGYSSAYPAVVILDGETRCFGVSSLVDVQTLANVMLSGPVTGLQGDAASGIALASPTTDPTTMRDDQQWFTDYRLMGSSGTASWVDRGTVQGEAAPRFVRDVNGTVQLGPGGTAALDVTYQRQDLGGGAAALGITPGVYAPRYVRPVLADVVPASGAVTLDASVADRYTVSLTSACTSLSVTNMVEGQYLTVLFKQPTTASALGIGSISGSSITAVQWQGGAAPALSVASRAVSCSFLLSAGVLYEVARSCTAAPEPWTSATLASNVSNYGNGYNDVQYQRNATGVRLRGTFVTSTTLGAKSRLFTLPTGYRSAKTWNFAVYGGTIQVLASGYVQNLAQIKPGVQYSLDGISFSLD